MYYKKAVEQVPEVESFQVKQGFVAPSDPTRISKAELLDEINWKLSTAYLNQAKYHANHPSIIGYTSKSYQKECDNCDVKQSQTCIDVQASLNHCLEHAEKVKPGKITENDKNERITVIKTAISRIPQQVTGNEAEQHKLKDSGRIAQMKDVTLEIEEYQNRQNAFLTGIDTFTIQRVFRNAEEVEHARSYLDKVAAFNGNGMNEMEGSELTLKMEHLTLMSKPDA